MVIQREGSAAFGSRFGEAGRAEATKEKERYVS